MARTFVELLGGGSPRSSDAAWFVPIWIKRIRLVSPLRRSEATRFLVYALAISIVLSGCSAVDNSSPKSLDTNDSADSTLRGGFAGSVGGDFDAPGVAPGEVPDGAVGLNAAAIARQLIFSGEMDITVQDVEATSSDIVEWIAQSGGFVESSSSSQFDGRPSMHFVLRVPSEDYDALRDHIRSVAIQVELDQSRRVDVTSQHADYGAKLETMRLAESELRELLAAQNERGGDVETVLSIHRELRGLRTEIDGLQAQLDVLDEQIALSTLTLSLAGESAVSGDGRAWRVGSTFRSATRDLNVGVQRFLEGLVYFLVAVLPIVLLWSAVLSAGAWLVVRIARIAGFRRPSGRGPTKPSRRDAAQVASKEVAAKEDSPSEDEGSN